MFEEAVANEPYDVLPVVIALVGNFFLQDGTDGDHRRKRIPEYEELQEKFPAQHTQTSCKDDCYNPHDLDDRREQLKQPQIRESKATDPAVTRPEEHIPVRPEHVQQTLLPARATDSRQRRAPDPFEIHRTPRK